MCILYLYKIYLKDIFKDVLCKFYRWSFLIAAAAFLSISEHSFTKMILLIFLRRSLKLGRCIIQLQTLAMQRLSFMGFVGCNYFREFPFTQIMFYKAYSTVYSTLWVHLLKLNLEYMIRSVFFPDFMPLQCILFVTGPCTTFYVGEV